MQYRWEARRFVCWLHERINAGLLPSGPFEDAARLELAIFDAQTARHSDGSMTNGNAAGEAQEGHRTVRLRYAPDALLNPAIPPHALEPVEGTLAILVDATGEDLAICRVPI
jgi:hypothetical protein